MVLDSHIDTPSSLLRGRIIGRDNPYGHVDFPKLRRGGVDGSFFALYTPPGTPPDAATRHAVKMLAALQDAVEEHSDEAAFAFRADDVVRNARSGRLSVLVGMENGAPIQESLSLLRFFYRQGIRYLTLTHNEDNAIADSAAGQHRWGGLSPFGREVLKELNRLGIMTDLSHASDDTFWQCLERSSAPIIASHSCCRALCGHRRNLTDEMIRALGEKDGYVGINFYPSFLDDSFGKSPADAALLDEADQVEASFRADPFDPARIRAWEAMQDRLLQMPRPGVERVVDHIDHAVSLAGVEHVGIGTDFDGIEVPPKGLDNVGMLPAVFAEMRRRGYSEAAISRISGDNLLDVMKRVEIAATRA